MKSIMAAVLLTAAIASPALAQQVPFRGTVEGVDSDAGGAFPFFLRSVSGRGHASHLGQFTMTVEWQLNVLTEPRGGSGVIYAHSGQRRHSLRHQHRTRHCC